MAAHSSILACRILWMEEPEGLLCIGSHRVRHDWSDLVWCMHWRRKWQPTPVFLPGESQGWRSLVGCRLWGRTESDMTEVTAAAAAIHLIEEYVDKFMSEIWPSNPADKAFFIELWTSTNLKINNGFFLELKYLLMGKVHLVKRSDGSYNKPVQKVTETLTFKREESYPCTSGAEERSSNSLRPLSISTRKFPSRVNS